MNDCMDDGWINDDNDMEETLSERQVMTHIR